MKDLAKLKKADLLTIAFEKGLASTVDSTNTKTQIIAAIDLAAIDLAAIDAPDVGEIIEGANGVNLPTQDEGPVDEHGYPLSRYPGSDGKPSEDTKNADNYRESQNIDARVLTSDELFRIIAKDKGSNPYRKFKYIKMFEKLNPGFKWPQTSPISRLTFMKNLAHYQQYKDTPK